MTDGTNITTTEYMAGYQYTNNVLDFFPHTSAALSASSEGYVKAVLNSEGTSNDYVFRYVFNFTDHLGNIRLKYAQDPSNNNEISILEEDHYYPYGLKHKGYNTAHKIFKGIEGPGTGVILTPVNPFLGDSYKYKFGGKEYQDEFDINTYDFGARNYDPALGRWMNIDPLAEQMRRHSPYNYAFDNPIFFIDPDGMMGIGFVSQASFGTADSFIDMSDGGGSDIGGGGGGDDILRPTFQDAATKTAYQNTVQNATGGLYQVSQDPLINGGNATFTQVAEGPLTQEQQAFVDEYKSVIDSPTVVNQEIVSNDINTVVGSFQNNTMDMADIAQFDAAGKGATSSAGAVIHETVEQLEKAKLGIAKGSMGSAVINSAGQTTYPNYISSHATALQAENRVNGNVRTEGFRVDSFLEKNGNVTRQAIIQQVGGTIKVMKQ